MIITENVSISEGQFAVYIVRGYSANINIALSSLPIQFRFIQFDHRREFCDCWAVANLTATLPNGQATELLYVLHFSKIMEHLDYLS